MENSIQSDYIKTVLEDFKVAIQNPEIFLDDEDSFVSDSTEKIKYNLKRSYDFLKTENVLSSSALPELLIRNFDTEQIWQQLELQNETLLKNSIRDISRLVVNKNKLIFDNISQKQEIEKDDIENNMDFESSEDDTDELDETKINDKRIEQSDEESSEDPEDKNNFEQYSSDEDSDEERMNLDNNSADAKHDDGFKKTQNKTSVLDDDFFKLDEMEKFLETEEKKLNNPEQDKKQVESDSDSEGSIDLFKNDLDNHDDEEEMKVKTARFKDFYRATDTSKEPKRNKFLEDMSDDEDNELKSTLELRQERLNKKIEEIEDNAVSDKPWTLKGEISGENRPQNSLLEEVVEFDLTSRPAPVITEKTTQQLEDIIRQRIKDKLFDSVIRKEKPIETLLEYKKKLVLDQEKSKHSLAQIYEKEYLEKQATVATDNVDKEEEEPVLHKEVKTMMRELFNKLDSLSNFHFTPKPAIPELKIITNLPAIVIEEVAPVTVSDASLLAPEEVRNKQKGDIIGKSERTKTDKKRERRKKKQKQQHHVQKVINKNLISGDKNKLKKTKEKVFNNKNIEKMVETLTSKSLKSSKAFFTQLQEQVQSQKSDKQLDGKKKRSSKTQLRAKKVKL